MTIEQRDKYAYELMVKNNPEEAIKQLLLKDKENENLHQRIDKTIKYCEESSKTIKSEYFSDVLKILKGDK